MCGHTPTILALEKKRQEDHREFKAVWVTKHIPVRAPKQDLLPNKKTKESGVQQCMAYPLVDQEFKAIF